MTEVGIGNSEDEAVDDGVGNEGYSGPKAS